MARINRLEYLRKVYSRLGMTVEDDGKITKDGKYAGSGWNLDTANQMPFDEWRKFVDRSSTPARDLANLNDPRLAKKI